MALRDRRPIRPRPILSRSSTWTTASLVLIGWTGQVRSEAPFWPARLDFPTGDAPAGVIAHDLNGDLIPDLAVSSPSEASVSVLLGIGHGDFHSRTPFYAGNSPTCIAVADFDGDHDADPAVANSDTLADCVAILLGAGDGTFGAPGFLSLPLTPYDGRSCAFSGVTRPWTRNQ